MCCLTCPFKDGNEDILNLGCLPEPYEIIKMKEQSNNNWACHNNDKITCKGFVSFIKEFRPDLNLNQGNLISYKTWYHKGPEKAIQEANRRN